MFLSGDQISHHPLRFSLEMLTQIPMRFFSQWSCTPKMKNTSNVFCSTNEIWEQLDTIRRFNSLFNKYLTKLLNLQKYYNITLLHVQQLVTLWTACVVNPIKINYHPKGLTLIFRAEQFLEDTQNKWLYFNLCWDEINQFRHFCSTKIPSEKHLAIKCVLGSLRL